jgi:hypothetical protein
MGTHKNDTDCWRSRISYSKGDDRIYIEHFSRQGRLLSKATMDFEDAYDYARMLLDVTDCAMGVD